MLSCIDKDAIIPDDWVQFVLVSPSTLPTNGLITLPFVCETACRLLFLSVHWASSLPAFQALRYYLCSNCLIRYFNSFVNVLFSKEIQVPIMRSAWSELFAVGLSQSQNLLPLTSVISALLININIQVNCSSSRLTTIAEYASKLKQFIKTMESINLDDFEYSSLKVLALFSPGKLIYNHIFNKL